jgi:hypothetical protein
VEVHRDAANAVVRKPQVPVIIVVQTTPEDILPMAQTPVARHKMINVVAHHRHILSRWMFRVL